jgi:hypothetical protein
MKDTIGGDGLMVATEVVYRYGTTNGEVVDRYEVGPDTNLPSVGDTIMIPDGSGGRCYVVKSRYPPSTASLEREEVVSAYTLVVQSAYR